MKEFNNISLKTTKIPEETKVLGKPFVKWVGGKGSLTNVLIKNLPSKYNCYYEPFVGGGALFFKLNPEKSFLSDINLDLIITYNVIKNRVGELIKKLKTYKKNHELEGKEFYLKVRSLNNMDDDVSVAARFIYLNKTCYNGLYRVNRSGGFNVPMGSYKKPLILDEETLLNDNMALQNAAIERVQYNEIKPLKKDFIYIDPPYDETYNGYDSNVFNVEKQKELASFCKSLDRRGCYFMLSNSDTENIRSLYKNFNIMEVDNIRSVNCKGNGRGKTKELLVKNYG